MNSSPQASKKDHIQKVAIAMILVALGMLFAVPHLAHYQLQQTHIDELVSSDAHGPEFKSALQNMVDKEYSHQVSFIRDIWAAIESVNAQTNDWQKQINTSYAGKDYVQAFVKIAGTGTVQEKPSLWLLLTLGLLSLGGVLYNLAMFGDGGPGIKNNGVVRSNLGSRGALGIIYGLVLVLFYIFLYRYPEYIQNWFTLADPVAQIFGAPGADRWFFYGLLYTIAVSVMGVRMFAKYRHSRYHQIRTASVILFQLGFAFIIPNIMSALNQPSMDLKLAWPLDYSFFYTYRLDSLRSSTFGMTLLVWGIALPVLVVPIMTYFFGKRWYCSWVCGCGALAENLGDAHRHLSDKSTRAWKVERILIHSVLVFAVLMTGLTVGNYLSEGAWFGSYTWKLQESYGFFVGFVFAGAVGTGFYPIMGNRVWCRFGCPLAAYLGIVQRFKSRFRITTNGGQCISCGNCSTHCEMGIDVRAYAQRGENIVRASCVGCGVCSAVCPRGVLTLENGPSKIRHQLTLLN